MCRGLSQRRSCTLLGVARSALGYRSTKAEKDAPVLTRTWSEESGQVRLITIAPSQQIPFPGIRLEN
jgi:hypothetical protein